MESNYKHKIVSLALLLSFGTYIYFASTIFLKLNINLENVSKFSGAIENIEIKDIETKTLHKAMGIK